MAALTLTNLIPSIQKAMDVVSREQIGLIPAVARDSSAERAAIGQIVVSPVVGIMAAENLTAANVAADTPAQTINNVQMQITKSRSVPFGITGEETLGLRNAGTLGDINQQRIEQALRTLSNEIEEDIAALHISASRAYGTATGTPFNTAGDFSDFANVNKILDDNGAPLTDRQLVLGSANIARLRGKQSGLFEVNRAGTDELLRRGIISKVQGLDLHQTSARPCNVAQLAGTAASATTDAAGYAVGSTTITLASAGTGAFIAGDIVSFAGDTNQYVLVSGDTDVSGGGTIVLAEPGLRVAMSAAAKAITLVADTTRNMFFHRSAIQLATRAPAMPEMGDDADDIMMVTDPVSNITYELIVYKQKRQIRYELNLAWGVKVIAPRHIGLLIGA